MEKGPASLPKGPGPEQPGIGVGAAPQTGMLRPVVPRADSTQGPHTPEFLKPILTSPP